MSFSTPNNRLSPASSGGGTTPEVVNPPVPLDPDSQNNWDASKVGSLVQVTEAVFNAAMAATPGAVQYGFNDIRMGDTTTIKSSQDSSQARGICEGTFTMSNPLVTTSVPANNYIVGVKVRVNSVPQNQFTPGFLSILTTEDKTTYPLSDKKMYAELGHSFLSKSSVGGTTYEYFLIKGAAQKTTTKVCTYMWSYHNFYMTMSIGTPNIRSRTFTPPTALNDTQFTSASLIMMQMWATPTKP
jgi:hypothetical protein